MGLLWPILATLIELVWSTPTPTSTIPIQMQIQKSKVKRFKQKNLVWIDNQHKDFDELTKQFRIINRKTVDDALIFLQEFYVLDKIKVICDGCLSQQFFYKIKQSQIKITGVYIYSAQAQIYQYLKENPLVKCVESTLQNLIAFISKQMVDFQMPSFRRFCDKTEKSTLLKYSYMLTGISVQIKDLKKRAILLSKFLAALKRYLSTEKDIPIQYPQQVSEQKHHKQVLQNYSGIYIHQYVNSLLKTNIFMYIRNAEIIISDLYHAIKQFSKHQCRKKIAETICYRGASLSQEEIDLLPQLVGEYIEFLGFLSTSVSKRVVQEEFSANSLFTIYIPDFIKSKQSAQLKLRGGYVDMRGISFFEEQQQILFNIKTMMRMINYFTQETSNGKVNFSDLIYGIDEIICHIYKNKTLFQFNLQQKNTTIECSCNSEIHIIGAVSKIKKCLINLKKEDFQNQSFFVVNTQKKLTGMVVTYSKDIEKDIFEKRNKLTYKKACQKCESIVKCSDCEKSFCLCFIQTHNPQHLQKSVIMIQSYIPRFIQLSLQRDNISFFNNYRQFEENINCIADGLLYIKQVSSYNEANKMYDKIINETDQFKKLSSQAKFKMFFNRGESIRLKKYIPNAADVTSDQLMLSLNNYQNCLDIAESQSKNPILICRSLLHIGIIEDDLKRFENAYIYYGRAMQVLIDIEAERDLTFKEKMMKCHIKNCKGFYYIHINDYEKGYVLFKQAIEDLKAIQNYSQAELAKYYNNLTYCLNLLQRYEQSIITGKISYDLRVLLFGSDHSLTQMSLYNYKKAKFGMIQPFIKQIIMEWLQ